MAEEHPGFKAVQSQIASKEGIGAKAAGAILASSTRNASPEAKEKNPNLNRVKGSAISRRLEKNKKSRES